MLPCDSHVHSEWSWDAPLGDMEASCARAVERGLPALAFTEHLDHTVMRISVEGPYADGHLTSLAGPDGLLTPPAFDPIGDLAAIEHCRERFPGLRILSGLEMGEPHWHAEQCAGILAAGRFDRVLGSLHTLPHGAGFTEPPNIYPHREPRDVVRDYLAEVATMMSTGGMFSVLAHIDYPVRSWPTERAGPFDPRAFEEEFRHALRTTARSGRALEINTRLPLHAVILGWWHEEGGDAVTFGSDAHLPAYVGAGFADAAQMAESYGVPPRPEPARPVGPQQMTVYTDVILVRHARSVPPTAEGPDEFTRPLTADGLRQALDLVTPLTEHRPAAVWSSPYQRAIQTVRPAAQALGLPVRTRWELREWDDGLPYTDEWEPHYVQSWADPSADPVIAGLSNGDPPAGESSCG